MEKDELKLLFKKYNDGTATEQERAMLEAWYLKHNEQEEIPYRQINAVKDRLFRELPGNENSFLKIGTRLMAAAVIIGILITVTIHFLPQNKMPQKQQLAHDIPPGTNKAILKLANGRQINLSDAKNGQLVAQNGIQVTKNSAGQVTYKIAPTSVDHSLNTIETPKGGQWKIELPDGTNVWLNAATSLTFPASFAQLADRAVTLNGEAYFEVAKDKAHPFIVKTKGQEVEVLGTHFNINAYTDEANTRTTLAEGSVKVTASKGKIKHLEPSQKATLTGTELTVGKANLKEDLAWVNGQFIFNDEPIQSVMRRLSRWYNVDFEFQGIPTEDGMNGRVSRYKNISQVLSALEATQTVHFKVEGRRITVMR